VADTLLFFCFDISTATTLPTS